MERSHQLTVWISVAPVTKKKKKRRNNWCTEYCGLHFVTRLQRTRSSIFVLLNKKRADFWAGDHRDPFDFDSKWWGLIQRFADVQLRNCRYRSFNRRLFCFDLIFPSHRKMDEDIFHYRDVEFFWNWLNLLLSFSTDGRSYYLHVFIMTWVFHQFLYVVFLVLVSEWLNNILASRLC